MPGVHGPCPTGVLGLEEPAMSVPSGDWAHDPVQGTGLPARACSCSKPWAPASQSCAGCGPAPMIFPCASCASWLLLERRSNLWAKSNGRGPVQMSSLPLQPALSLHQTMHVPASLLLLKEHQRPLKSTPCACSIQPGPTRAPVPVPALHKPLDQLTHVATTDSVPPGCSVP